METVALKDQDNVGEVEMVALEASKVQDAIRQGAEERNREAGYDWKDAASLLAC